MADDTGLQHGAADLRNQELLLDFTIKVQGQEFRVHKFALAAVSDYFRAMICRSMAESTNCMVELEGAKAEQVSQLIDFIYTGGAKDPSPNPFVRKMDDDTGLQMGAWNLRTKQLLLDFTIKVQGQEFRVHKFVLASVSDYFRAMICGSMAESTNDMVELKEVKAELVSQLLDFIYTGIDYYIDINPKEMLDMAVYFQMPKVVHQCREYLRSKLSVKDCVDLLSTFKTYSMDNEVKSVSHFIKGHTTEVMQHYSVKDITPDVVPIILDNWSKSEWDMFQFILSWIGGDLVNRKTYTSEFMSHVRFSIMPPQQVKEIRGMDEYAETKGPWKDLVEKAFIYHQQSTLLKVSEDSNQNKFRFGKSPFLLSIGSDSGGKTKFSALVKDEDKSSYWEDCTPIDSPEVAGQIPFVLEVNNFLVTCSQFGEKQSWQVFDPLTLTWTKMANMPTPKDAFAMVYCNKHLYVLGGSTGSGAQTCVTDTIDEYSFETNSWISTKKLPVAVKSHSACVLNNAIYVSGGIGASGKTARMDCLDITAQKWENKAPLHKPMANHKTSVMLVQKHEVIVAIDTKVIGNGYHWLFDNGITVRYYNPLCDQWSTCDFRVESNNKEECGDRLDFPYKEVMNLKWSSESMMLVDGINIYLLNVRGEEWREYEETFSWQEERVDEFVETSGLCAKWRVEDWEFEKPDLPEEDESPEELNMSEKIDILEFAMADFPRSYRNVVGGVLVFSPGIIPSPSPESESESSSSSSEW